MGLSTTNRWVEIVSNIGIIGGLLLVGAEMKQNSDLLRMQMLVDESRSLVEHEREMLGDNPSAVWARSMQSPEALTLEERRVMEAYLWIFAEQLRSTYLLAQEGLLDADEWHERVYSDAQFYYNNPYGAAWWKAFSRNDSYPREIIEMINTHIAGVERNTMEYFDETLMNLGAGKEDGQ